MQYPLPKFTLLDHYRAISVADKCYQQQIFKYCVIVGYVFVDQSLI